MNDPQHQLQRLLKAAAQAAPPENDAPPFGFETRVLARWRSAPAIDSGQILASLFRRAIICAGVLMLLTIALTYQDLTGSASLDATLVTSALRMNLWP